MTLTRGLWMAAGLTALVVVSGAVTAGGNQHDGNRVGLFDLADRIGKENLPTGVGVVVAQTEIPDGQGDYVPNLNNSNFDGKTFFYMSGDSDTNGHATDVGKNYYGNDISIAPGIDTIYNWEVNNWIGSGYLNALGGNTEPDPTPEGVRMFNHSWIGTAGNDTTDNDILRRADFTVLRDNLLFCVGVGNTGDPNFELMGHNYNGLTVGVFDGTHVFAATLSGIDGPGRLKPEIVAPGSATSWASPVVGAAGALLMEVGAGESLGGNPNAQRSDVIKAVLLAGAAKTNDHGSDWFNNANDGGAERGVTVQPLDKIIGAGTVNINFAHMIYTGEEQDGAADPPAESTITNAGWDLATIPQCESRFYRFRVLEAADAVSIIATWHRHVEPPFGFNDWSVADFDLTLWRVDEKGQLTTLIGDPGLPFFDGGSISSQSVVMNIEHLHVTGLQPGDYVIEVVDMGCDGEAETDVAVAWLMPEQPVIVGDLNGDGVVDGSDLIQLLGAWGPCDDCKNCPEDLDGDCIVGSPDLIMLLGNWG